MEYDIEISLENKSYFKKGTKTLHREDGPAVECNNGDLWWYIDGILHRENGPAVEYADGDKSWWINGIRHRENGPAIEYKDFKGWYINGQRLSVEKEKLLNKWWNNKNGI